MHVIGSAISEILCYDSFAPQVQKSDIVLQLLITCVTCDLLQDAVAVWNDLFSSEAPPIVIVGHSMGGAVAVRCAASQVSKLLCICSFLISYLMLTAVHLRADCSG